MGATAWMLTATRLVVVACWTLLMIPRHAAAQTWTKYVGVQGVGDSSDEAIVLPTGDIAVASDWIPGFGEPRLSGVSLFSPEGEALWNVSTSQLGDTFIAGKLAATDEGDLYVVGSAYPVASGGPYFWVSRIRSDGVVEWDRGFQDPYTGAGNVDAVATADGGVLVAGRSVVAGHLFKIDRMGGLEWARVWQLSEVMLVRHSPLGGLVLGSLLSGDGPGLAIGLIRLADDGSTEWELGLLFPDRPFAWSMDVGSDGSIWLVGNMDQGTLAGTGWVARVLPEGTVDWVRFMRSPGGDMQVIDVAVRPDGTAVVVGHARNLPERLPVWLLFNDAGTVEWQHRWQQPPAVLARAVASLPDGRMMVLLGGSDGIDTLDQLMLIVEPDGLPEAVCPEVQPGFFEISDGEWTLDMGGSLDSTDVVAPHPAAAVWVTGTAHSADLCCPVIGRPVEMANPALGHAPLRMRRGNATRDIVLWPEPTAADGCQVSLYRGRVSDLRSGVSPECLRQQAFPRDAVVDQNPIPGEADYFVVGAVSYSKRDPRGPAGFSTYGVERPLSSDCP